MVANIEVYNQSFSVELHRELPYYITNRLNTYRYQNKKMVLTGQYYIYLKHQNRYFFLDTDLRDILSAVKTLGYELKANDKRCKIKYNVELPFVVDFTPREEQAKYIEDITTNVKKSNRYLIDFETGGGKTFIACYSLHKMKERFLVYIRATYISKWINDIKFYYGLNDDEIFIIKGGKSLEKIFKGKVDIDRIKVFIVSTSTMNVYFNHYIDNTLGDVIKPPMDLLKTIKTNIVLMDEVHQHFKNVYQSVLLLNPRYIIALSATLITYDKKLMNIYNKLFPPELRLSYSNFKPFVTYVASFYNFKSLRGLKYKRSIYGYSHNELERTILRQPMVRDRYFNMIYDRLKKYFLDRKEKKDEKCIIFVSSIEFANKLKEYLHKKIHNNTISRYVEDDPYENIISNNITVTTLLSAGTAIDIPGLITVVDTVNTDSLQSNVQSLGRLREDKKTHREMIYVQLISKDIPQHTKYYYRFKNFWLIKKAKKIIEENYTIEV